MKKSLSPKTAGVFLIIFFVIVAVGALYFMASAAYNENDYSQHVEAATFDDESERFLKVIVPDGGHFWYMSDEVTCESPDKGPVTFVPEIGGSEITLPSGDYVCPPGTPVPRT